MPRISGALAIALFVSTLVPARANDWEKFYRATAGVAEAAPAVSPPEILPTSGNLEGDLTSLWERGFTAIGFSSFNSPNSATKDAVKFATKLKAQYLIIETNLASSRTGMLPLTTPTATTSQTNGNVSVYGSGGSATGNYSGTTTTYGSQTTYVPFTVNRFDKIAVYFQPALKRGIGILSRPLNPTEVAAHETQRGFVIRAVRRGSPAYNANILPGDVILSVADTPADLDTWARMWEAAAGAPLKLGIVRNGQKREITVSQPADWR